MISHVSTAGAILLASKAACSVLMNNGLAATPQMGWDNWNAFGCDVSQDLLIGSANRIVEIGLRDVGYYYVILDDCWSDGRYKNGSLKPDFTKFPNGMGWVADQMHSMDLGFGMYSSAGKYTCAQYAGSLGYEETDANTWASWGVDYLKYDNCFNEGQSGTANISYERYARMSTALNATGRPILYSMCNWGQDHPWDWAMTIANSWRATGDIFDTFDRPDVRCPCEEKEGANCYFPGFHCSIMNIINKMVWTIQRSQPGGWNDLDGLEVGNGGMNDEEYKLHFTMWAAMKSPLIIGTDITTMDAQTYSIYTNPAILALSQDPEGAAIIRKWRYFVSPADYYGIGEIQMHSGSLSNGDYVVVLLNAASHEMHMNATAADIFADEGGSVSKEAKSNWDVYDLWADRMPDDVANQVLRSNSTTGVARAKHYLYNATETSYADGIAAGNALLMGKKVGTLESRGTLKALVPPHGVMAYRLRPAGSPVSEFRENIHPLPNPRETSTARLYGASIVAAVPIVAIDLAC